MKILIAWIAKFIGHNGGMDKVFANFANEMTKRGHHVTLVYCTDLREGKSYTPILPSVKMLNLADFIDGKKWESRNKPLTFKIMREFLRIIDKEKMKDFRDQYDVSYLKTAVQKILDMVNPDIIITMDGKATVIFRSMDSWHNVPIITMSHFDAESIWKNSSNMTRQALSDSDWLQVLMPLDVVFFKSHLPDAHIIHIPNVVPQYDEVTNNTPKDMYRIIDVARLYKKQKQQHLLIEAFAKIADQFPNWQLEFWGEEQEGNKYTHHLQNLIQKFHLEKRVFLRGNSDNVLSVYSHSDIFAFPSSYEGFPLAMTEAMSAGLPVVAYKSCPAVNELVQSGINGILVDDGVDALAEGLQTLMSHERQRIQMGKAARKSMEPYSSKVIWDRWEQLIINTVRNS